jgi:transcriptional regulator with XRE-family HTH domain
VKIKSKKQIDAKKLRTEGYSIREISSELGVSKSSVSRWVREICLTDEQIITLQRKNPANGGCYDRNKAGQSTSATWGKRRKLYQDEGRLMTKNRDVDFIAGCMLYWAEGKKSRNTVCLVNTDCEMIKVFVTFLRKWFDVKDDEFSLSVQWYSSSGNTTEIIQKYWANELGLPMSCMRKFQLDSISKYSQKKKGNKHPFGTCSIQVNRTDIVQKIYGAIQEYGKFLNEKWLW